jgi:UDP-N-acetylmuramoyl-L-alanyl-D-glutamate--2,6-diaminopimelate ligase
LQLSFNDSEVIQTKMRGTYNAYNMGAVFGAAVLLQQDERDVLQALTHVTGARGRFEYHKVAGKQFIVDYAHTPDALENLLQAVRNVISLQAKMIGVVGCGGDRDTAKRPMMARLAQEYCDIAVFTSDNPRTENPADIWEDMRKGLENPDDDSAYMVELDRKKAIEKALETAGSDDVVVIAGKGHETYQEVHGEKLPFDDAAIATQIAQSL